jgi:hypothetical protein
MGNNGKMELAHSLSRDMSQRTATEIKEQEPERHEVHKSEQTQAHTLEIGLV